MIYLISNTPKKGVKHIKIIGISFLRPKLTCKGYDAIIFTSKNAVKALNKLDFSWQKIPSFAIGKATANEIKKYGGKVEFISQNSYGDDFANEIKPLLKNKKILFPRAKKVVSNIKELLHPLHVKELIVYKTKCLTCKDIKKPPPKSTLIFTSPSSIKCFLKCFKWDKTYTPICIGKKTANALPKDITCKIPQIQSIDECVKLALGFNNKSHCF